MRFALVLAVVAGCAHDVTTRFPSGPEESTSSLVLLMSDVAQVSVAVNGLLVVQDAHTRRIVIDRVPIGTAEVVMTANGADKSFKVWVGGDHATTVPLGAGPEGSTSFVKALLEAVSAVVVYALIR